MGSLYHIVLVLFFCLFLGDLLIENFFKELKRHNRDASPTPSPVVDNVLVKLVNITLSRAVMTLAGTLEVQVCYYGYGIV